MIIGGYENGSRRNGPHQSRWGLPLPPTPPDPDDKRPDDEAAYCQGCGRSFFRKTGNAWTCIRCFRTVLTLKK